MKMRLAIAGFLMVAALRAAPVTYVVSLPTTGWAPATYSFAFDMLDNDGAAANNTATIANFQLGGGSLAPAPLSASGVAGALPGGLTIGGGGTYIHEFTPGSSLSFTLTAPNAWTGDFFFDSFTMYLFADGMEVATAGMETLGVNAVFGVDFTGGAPDIWTFASADESVPFGAPTATVPEPGAWLLTLAALGALWWRRRAAALAILLIAGQTAARASAVGISLSVERRDGCSSPTDYLAGGSTTGGVYVGGSLSAPGTNLSPSASAVSGLGFIRATSQVSGVIDCTGTGARAGAGASGYFESSFTIIPFDQDLMGTWSTINVTLLITGSLSASVTRSPPPPVLLDEAWAGWTAGALFNAQGVGSSIYAEEQLSELTRYQCGDPELNCIGSWGPGWLSTPVSFQYGAPVDFIVTFSTGASAGIGLAESVLARAAYGNTLRWGGMTGLAPGDTVLGEVDWSQPVEAAAIPEPGTWATAAAAMAALLGVRRFSRR